MPEELKQKLMTGAPYLLVVLSYFYGETEGREEAILSHPPSYTVNSPVSVNCSAGEFKGDSK